MPIMNKKNNKLWYVETNKDQINLEEVCLFLNNEYKNYLYNSNWTYKYFKWKIENINPNGLGYIAVTKSGDKILGTLTLTRKKILLNNEIINSFEIGDSYIKKNIYKYYQPKNILNNKDKFINKSVFGRMVHDLLDKIPDDSLVYGSPNKESENGYIKNLNFEIYNNSKIYNFLSPSIYSVIRIKTINYFFNTLKKIFFYLIKYISNIQISNNLDINDFNNNLIDYKKNYLNIFFDKKIFKHRFLDIPVKKYSYFKIYNSKKQIKAIIIYKIIKTQKNRDICYILDIFTENSFLKYAIFLFKINFNNKFVHAYIFWCNYDYKFDLNLNSFIKYDTISTIFYKNKFYMENIYRKKIYLNFKISSFDVV